MSIKAFALVYLNNASKRAIPRVFKRANASGVFSSENITFYDIPSKLPQRAWSPNTWKTRSMFAAFESILWTTADMASFRFSLNYKGIPYKTQWVEYPDIADHCKDMGISPTARKADGSPVYTLPAIYDPSTGISTSDSLAIAEYLERTYPMAPKLFPEHSIGLQTAFVYAFRHQMASTWQFIYAPECAMLNPRSAQYFRCTREETFGRMLEDLIPNGEKGEAEWAKFKAGLGRVSGWYAKSGGPFLMGQSPSWADFVVGAHIVCWRSVWGEESEQWKDISSWNGGRWKALSEHLRDYEKVL